MIWACEKSGEARWPCAYALIEYAQHACAETKPGIKVLNPTVMRGSPACVEKTPGIKSFKASVLLTSASRLFARLAQCIEIALAHSILLSLCVCPGDNRCS